MTPTKTRPHPQAQIKREGLEPALFFVGDTPMVLPGDYDRLHPATQQAVRAVEALAALGDKAAVSRAVLAFEDRHGITTEHRIAVMRPANDSDLALEAAIKLAMGSIDPPPPVKPPKGKRGRGRPAKAAQPKLPTTRRAVPFDLEERFDKAHRAAMSAKTKDDRETAIRAKEAVVKEIAARQEGAYLEGVHREVEKLESLRGGDVIVDQVVTNEIETDEAGAPRQFRGRTLTRAVERKRIRINNRDGLLNLVSSNLDKNGEFLKWPDGRIKEAAITARHYAAGMRYRGLVEAMDHERGLTPPDPDRASGGGGVKPLLIEGTTRLSDPAKINRDLESSDAAMALKLVEAAVLATCTASALQALRDVAGRGMTIYELTGRGSRRRAIRMLSGLTAALDALADHWGLQ